MKKGIGPRGLGAPKSVAKMYNSPAKKNGPGKRPTQAQKDKFASLYDAADDMERDPANKGRSRTSKQYQSELKGKANRYMTQRMTERLKAEGKFPSPAKKGKKKSSQQMYDERDARYTAKAKLDAYAKENPRASRNMPADQRERISQSIQNARLSELRTKRLNNK